MNPIVKFLFELQGISLLIWRSLSAMFTTPRYGREWIRQMDLIGVGSIPIVLLFDKILKAPTVLMGFGLHSENTHSPDEHFHLHNLYKGIEATAYFYEEMAQSK